VVRGKTSGLSYDDVAVSEKRGRGGGRSAKLTRGKEKSRPCKGKEKRKRGEKKKKTKFGWFCGCWLGGFGFFLWVGFVWSTLRPVEKEKKHKHNSGLKRRKLKKSRGGGVKKNKLGHGTVPCFQEWWRKRKVEGIPRARTNSKNRPRMLRWRTEKKVTTLRRDVSAKKKRGGRGKENQDIRETCFWGGTQKKSIPQVKHPTRRTCAENRKKHEFEHARKE